MEIIFLGYLAIELETKLVGLILALGGVGSEWVTPELYCSILITGDKHWILVSAVM
jgi:hypothetical protein